MNKKINTLEAMLLFDDENVKEIIVAHALEKCFRKRKQLYTPLKFDMHSIPDKNFLHLFRIDKADIVKL